MPSTTTLRSDTARTGTTPDFPINANPWRKYVSVDLGTTKIGGNTVARAVRAGVLTVENWLFNAGPLAGQTHTLVLVATTTNEIFCFGEGDLLVHGAAATPLWHTSLVVTPMMRGGSNIAPPLGVCGTPVVDAANRRMFVVAMWDDGSGTGNYSIFNVELDTGNITASQKLVDAGAPGRATFNADLLDQRTAINLVSGWLWLGFADYLAGDAGNYYGWVVAINPGDLTKQLYQPMVSSSGIYGGGVWGPGGVAAATDGTVYALTGNAPTTSDNYWQNKVPATGPGSLGDYFIALVHLGIIATGPSSQLKVLDWFQSSNSTKEENGWDFDFGGSSPVVLPPINGRQLVAFVPKDGDIFVLDSQHLGNYTTPLTRVPFAQATNNQPDTKVAIAFLQTPDGRNILIVGADTNDSNGGFAAFKIDATATPPTLTQLWKASSQPRDSFGSPIVITNPVPDPSNPPNPVGLAWVIDGADAGDNFLHNCAMRAFDVLTGAVAYDSTVKNDVTEEIPHFAPITSSGTSVFCSTSKGFIGFTQFVTVPKSLTFIVDRSTFGQDEVDSLEPTPTSVANYNPAYWIALYGVLPSDLGLNPSNLGSPPKTPTVTPTLDPSLPNNVSNAIQAMLNASKFSGPVIPENPSLPDLPQTFLFPYTVAFTGDKGFQAMRNANPPIGATLVTLQGSMTVTGTPPLTNSTQLELITGADPFFLDVNPAKPTEYPTWLSFDLRLFKVTENSIKFGVQTPSNAADAPGFIAQVIKNLNAGTTGGDSFDGPAGLTQDEGSSALEFNQTDNYGRKVFNFALARVRLRGKTAGQTPYPVRVFFRLFQAQNTVSNFNPSPGIGTYRFATDGTPHGRKVPLLGVLNDAHGNPEYVTIPCFASARINVNANTGQYVAENMQNQSDAPNAYPITIITPGVEVDSYFGCWLDINQSQQKFLPQTPPADANGGWDGAPNGWTGVTFHSVQEAIVAAPHQCLIAEIRYDDAPIVPNATSSTSDKLAQRNIAWIDGPSHSLPESHRMTHPVQIRPTPIGALHPDELMVLWGLTPEASQAQLYLPELSATEIVSLANRLHSAQRMTTADEHTVNFDARGVTFLPLPTGTALAAGLLTVTLPQEIHLGDEYNIMVRQLTDATATIKPPPPPPPQITAGRTRQTRRIKQHVDAGKTVAVAVEHTWRRVEGAFRFTITIKESRAIRLNEERLLATLRWMLLNMNPQRRWYKVLQRYIDYVSGRVLGFGGNPEQILPSPTGWVHGLPKYPPYPPLHRKDVEKLTGKVEGIIFDHFGDFEGIVLETETGTRHRLYSRERAIHELAQHVKAERRRVRVSFEKRHRRILRMVVF